MSKGSTSAGAWTPDEVAERCRALGARVDLKGTKYRVYPPDGGGPVFFNAYRETNGSHLPNVLHDLRRLGLDLVAAEQERRSAALPSPMTRPAVDPDQARRLAAAVDRAAATPAAQRRYGTTTEQEPAMAAPKPAPPTPITFNVRAELAELREAMQRQGDSFLEMLTGYERRVEALEAELAAIRSGGVVRGPSTSELVRQAALAWFVAHPGQRTTPQLLELQLDADGALPAGTGKTMVAGGCRDLLLAGRLQGGGAKEGNQPTRGVYWYDPAQDPQAETDS